MSTRRFNSKVAAIFRECAELLRGQGANPFRINAYLKAAETLESLKPDASDILQSEGAAGLDRLPAIGKGLASSIEEIARTGRLTLLDRLRGEASSGNLFRGIPGIGPGLARSIADNLHVDTLEELEIAAHDGRLATVPGIGPRRIAAIRAGLAAILNRGARRRTWPGNAPPTELLLDVDSEYRRRAAAGDLPMIAPSRFNPAGIAWLPILHTERRDWHFTALYSNTALAHKLKRTDDWVVIYYYDGHHREGQNTVVTETLGPMKGLRVVRGRETNGAHAPNRGS